MGSKVYFDTTIFCGAFEGTADQAALLEPIFELAESSPGLVVTSDLTLAELLGKEAVRGWAWQSKFYADLLVHRRFIDLRSVSREVLVKTGHFRREAAATGRKVKLADAIHAVTAVNANCQLVFTADKRFYVPQSISVAGVDIDGGAAVSLALNA